MAETMLFVKYLLFKQFIMGRCSKEAFWLSRLTTVFTTETQSVV